MICLFPPINNLGKLIVLNASRNLFFYIVNIECISCFLNTKGINFLSNIFYKIVRGFIEKFNYCLLVMFNKENQL